MLLMLTDKHFYTDKGNSTDFHSIQRKKKGVHFCAKMKIEKNEKKKKKAQEAVIYVSEFLPLLTNQNIHASF